MFAETKKCSRIRKNVCPNQKMFAHQKKFGQNSLKNLCASPFNKSIKLDHFILILLAGCYFKYHTLLLLGFKYTGFHLYWAATETNFDLITIMKTKYFHSERGDFLI